MTTVERVGVGGPGRVGTGRAGVPQPGANFTVAPSVSGEQPVASAAIPTVSLEGVLALQGRLTKDEMDRQARRHGQALLTALSVLQRSLLAGGNAGDARARLEALVGDVPAADDPRLAAILGTIRLRTRVELARLMP